MLPETIYSFDKDWGIVLFIHIGLLLQILTTSQLAMVQNLLLSSLRLHLHEIRHLQNLHTAHQNLYPLQQMPHP